MEVLIDVKRQRRFDQGLWFWIGSPSLNTWGKGAIGYAVKTYHYILDTIKMGAVKVGLKEWQNYIVTHEKERDIK